MRSILRTLPIRWQITLLNAAILASVLAAGGVAVWNAQRTLQYDGLIAKQLNDLRALMPAELDPKRLGVYPLQKADAEMLKQLAFQKYLTVFAEQQSAKDRGVVLFAPNGSVLAKNNYGPACAPSVYILKAAQTANASEDLLKQLKFEQYVAQIEQRQLSLLIPVSWQQDQSQAIAQICVPTDAIDDSLNQLAIVLAIGWVLVVGVATALGVTATRRVLRPLDQVVATTGRIAAGDLGQRVGLAPGRTEIAQLGAAFDAMVARLEQAFVAQRRFVADAAHELRTPLTALSASVELLLIGAAGSDPAIAQRLLRHLDSELSRVIRLTNDLLTLSQLDARPQITLCPTNLKVLLEELAEHSRMLLRGQELIVNVEPGLWVEGDSDRLRQVVLNLLDNARKYTPPGGQIVLRAYADHRPPPTDVGGQPACPEAPPELVEGSVAVEVQDTGVGIPADALPQLFDRFYRVDSARARASGGSGLGLAIVQAIVQAHHGQVGIQSTPGVGTCATIQLPRLPMPST